MSQNQTNFTGRWLHHGDWHGKDFTHELPEYDHDEHPGASGSTKMRFATIAQENQQTHVWAPAHWTDAQIRAALSENW